MFSPYDMFVMGLLVGGWSKASTGVVVCCSHTRTCFRMRLLVVYCSEVRTGVVVCFADDMTFIGTVCCGMSQGHYWNSGVLFSHQDMFSLGLLVVSCPRALLE